MGQLPTEIKEKIIKLSEATGKPTADLMKRLKEILVTDPNIQTMEKEDFKVRFAWTVLYREHSTGGNDCYITLMTVPRIRDVNMKSGLNSVGEVYALVQKITKDDSGVVKIGETKYGAGTFWRDGAKNAHKLTPGKVYKTSIKITDAKWGVEITSDRATFTEVFDHKMPSIQQFYEEHIKPKNCMIGISEVDLNKSEYPTQLRTIEATVSNASIGEKDGNEWGRYEVYDDSVMEKVGNMTIFVDPKDVKWMQGSVLILGGHISERVDKKTNKTVIDFNTHFILPAGPDLAEPFKANIATKKKVDSVDLDMELGETKSTPKETTDDIDFSV